MYGFMDREWLGESYDNYNGNVDFDNTWFRKTPRECIKEKLRSKNQPKLDGHEPAVCAEESTTPKFDDGIRKIWECMSTDMMGNSQPTAGVFSGDNFAAGDIRVPTIMGGYTRSGRRFIKKNKKRNGHINENFEGNSSAERFHYRHSAMYPGVSQPEFEDMMAARDYGRAKSEIERDWQRGFSERQNRRNVSNQKLMNSIIRIDNADEMREVEKRLRDGLESGHPDSSMFRTLRRTLKNECEYKGCRDAEDCMDVCDSLFGIRVTPIYIQCANALGVNPFDFLNMD